MSDSFTASPFNCSAKTEEDVLNLKPLFLWKTFPPYLLTPCIIDTIRCSRKNNGAVMVHLFQPDIFLLQVWKKSFHFTAARICRLKGKKKELKESFHVIASTTKQRREIFLFSPAVTQIYCLTFQEL